MSAVYISNKGTKIHVQIENIHVQYQGPISLSRFLKINEYSDGCISVDTEFNIDNKIEVEEDYIDLYAVLGDYGYDCEAIISKIDEVRIGEKPMDKKTKANKTVKINSKAVREYIIDNALMISNNMALLNRVNSTNKIQILVINMARTNARALIELDTLNVLNSNMSKNMLDGSIRAIKRNYNLIIQEIEEINLNT